MKLGEALLERDHLKQLLMLLESHLREDNEQGRPLTHIKEELHRIANRWRDLEIAISWTQQQVAIAGLPLGAYVVRKKVLQRLADILKDIDREKEKQLLDAVYADSKVYQTAVWLIDLQIPAITKEEEK